MFSLLKIPFILANAFAFHVSYTPPNAPPPKGERVATPTLGDRYTSFMMKLLPVIKVYSLSSK
jgi:hypothetical protein